MVPLSESQCAGSVISKMYKSLESLLECRLLGPNPGTQVVWSFGPGDLSKWPIGHIWRNIALVSASRYLQLLSFLETEHSISFMKGFEFQQKYKIHSTTSLILACHGAENQAFHLKHFFFSSKAVILTWGLILQFHVIVKQFMQRKKNHLENGEFRREERRRCDEEQKKMHRKGKEKNQQGHVLATAREILSLGAHPPGKIYERWMPVSHLWKMNACVPSPEILV